MTENGPFGARVYLRDNNTVQIFQTRKRGKTQNAPYVIFPSPETHRGVFIDITNDKDLADAIRAALIGKLA